jgi:hypothetical protein
MDSKPDGRSYDQIVAGFRELEAELGAPSNSLVSLVASAGEEHDDWSFVIRAHAIIEGAVSQLLAAALDPRLKPVFEKIGLGRAGAGKLGFVKALGLLNDDRLEFIGLLSAIGNVLAHDLRHLDFTFDKHLSAMDRQQLRVRRPTGYHRPTRGQRGAPHPGA